MWTVEKVFNDNIVCNSISNQKLKNALESLIRNVFSYGIISVDIADLTQLTKSTKNVHVLVEENEFISNLELIPFHLLSKIETRTKTVWVNVWFCDNYDNNDVFEILAKIHDKIEPYLTDGMELIKTDAYHKECDNNTIEIVTFD
nr:hypothetical protein [uncultured Carboxylicivirga sp.]